jgi:predicted O-methyltransferase YrrM
MSTSQPASGGDAAAVAAAYKEHVLVSAASSSSVPKVAMDKIVSPELYAYVLKSGVREDDHLKKLRDLTEKHPLARMASPPDEAALLGFLVKLIGAKKAVEVGVFTGYSALATARALPADGKLIALDVSEEFAAVGKPVWEEAGVADRIDLRIAPAVESLDKLIAEEGQVGTFDFAFIDADKVSYDKYYERILKLLRPGGLLAIDNVLWHGKVIDESVNDDDTVAIRNLNAKVAADTRVDVVLLHISDGITLVRKN